MVEVDKEKNIIFLIGNGLDLHHKLKTKYSDFITYYIKQSIIETVENNKSRYEDDCFRIELYNNHIDWKDIIVNEIKNINDFSNYVIPNGQNSNHVNFRYLTIRILPKNDFIQDILLNCNNCNWNGIEDSIFKELKRNYNRIFQSNIDLNKINYLEDKYRSVKISINSLNSSVEELKIHLINYLKTENKPKNLNINLFNTIDFLHNDYNNKATKNRNILFLNFNYTTYLNERSINEIPYFRNNNYQIDFLNIHGTLNDTNEVIFGIGDEHYDFYSQIESYLDNDWLHTMKSFSYLRNDNYQKLLGFLHLGEYEIYILGHSCGITDRTLLNMLFEDIFCKKIHLFHYNGIKSYMNTSYNIARNFKNKVKLRQVLQPYNDNLKM